MAEYKNGVNALGNISVIRENTAAEVHTGRAVFVDENLYSTDSEYKAKVDKCVEEGFHRISEDGSSSGGTSSGVMVLRIVRKEVEGSATKYYTDHLWAEVAEAMANGIPVYYIPNTSMDIASIGNPALLPVVRLDSNRDGDFVAYCLDVHYSNNTYDMSPICLYADAPDGYLYYQNRLV